jgi:hypothetical protein
VGSLIYIFKVTSEVKVQTELKSTMTDKELVMKDLQELKRRTMQFLKTRPMS